MGQGRVGWRRGAGCRGGCEKDWESRSQHKGGEKWNCVRRRVPRVSGAAAGRADRPPPPPPPALRQAADTPHVPALHCGALSSPLQMFLVQCRLLIFCCFFFFIPLSLENCKYFPRERCQKSILRDPLICHCIVPKGGTTIQQCQANCHPSQHLILRRKGRWGGRTMTRHTNEGINSKRTRKLSHEQHTVNDG